MNNSKLVADNVGLEIEKPADNLPWLRLRQKELLEIIEAIQAVSASSYWKLLDQRIWRGVAESLKSRLSKERDEKEMYRLQGQIAWAEKYSDFAKLQEAYKLELSNILKQINAKRTT